MKILILNWRDIKNPASGGAEVLTHEIARYLVKQGNTVTLFTSEFPQCKQQETIDGIKIVRRGKSFTHYFFNSVHFLAFREYKKHFQGKIDMVIDEVHGLPFFTPWYVTEKKVALVCEVAGDLWIKMFGGVFGTLGRIVEILYLRFIYRNIQFITISQSAQEDLIRNGVKKESIQIIPVGAYLPKKKPVVKKEDNPTLIFVGRIARSKGLEDAILVVKELAKKYNLQLWICGKEDKVYLKELQDFAKKNNISEKVKFYGFVSEEKKYELLGKSWILIHPSKTEGWGINVIEGNYMGVPAVGYNVPGLQDSIQNGKTGLLTRENTIKELVTVTEQLLTDKSLYDSLSKQAIGWSGNFTWTKTGEKTWEILQKI